jgi:hypothetical protein
MMEEVCISETSVNFHVTTRRYIPYSYSPPCEPEISNKEVTEMCMISQSWNIGDTGEFKIVFTNGFDSKCDFDHFVPTNLHPSVRRYQRIN